MVLSGAQIVLEVLKEQGVERVFGYPGGRILALYDALPGCGIEHVLATHEQHAAFAAGGYARATGRPGVVFATSGPGATNLATGIADAFMDSVPLVAITCNVPTHMLGKDSFQEVDITGLTIPITKHNVIAGDVHTLADTLREAFDIACSGRQGPVLVDIPCDVAEAKCAYAPALPVKPRHEVAADAVDFAAAAGLIREAERPMLYAGGGVLSAGAEAELAELARRIGAPVALSLMGLGAYPASGPGFCGMMGMHGSRTSAQLLEETDLVIAVGARFSERSVVAPGRFAPGARVLHIDADAAEVNKNVRASYALIGDAKGILARLIELVDEKRNPLLAEAEALWRGERKSWPQGFRPRQLMECLARLCGPGQIYTTEVGQHQLWAAKYLPIQQPRTFLTSGGLGAMGFGLGAAIGAALGTGRRIINIAGDGSFYMNMAELATVAARKLDIVEIVLRNRTLGLVRQQQKWLYGENYSQSHCPGNADIPALARAFGLEGRTVRPEDDLEAALEWALARSGGVVLDVEIDAEDGALPMMMPDGRIFAQEG